ncbi:SGNH/GDSL hydrolase family protein [Pontibacter sp. SGAir0037]|uniref:SGNH/GDSL hydrolase family protein n=1 Tax=Pontibacter sp. SGAir0037 TaxID=2571030 RepID=UPI00143CE3D4|nr:SGNH/GDSL hydrolase family protein [Pontibacter sp. SGAir0037]
MKFRNSLFAVVWCLFCLGCASSANSPGKTDTLPATALEPFGRFKVNESQQLELISSAVHFGFSFEGTECQVYASVPGGGGHGYLQYELDGVYQKRVKVAGSAAVPILINVPKAGKHTVWVYKATEAHTGPIAIEKITGQNLNSLSKPAAPLIEFIGNSITCGAAADSSEVPCGTGVYQDQHNAYAAYGPVVARALNANFILSSVSGIGIYRNWNSNGPTMPQVYEKLDFQHNTSQRWNFSTYTPQVVSIVLGTNDFSNGDGKTERLPFDSTSFVNNYVKFVRLVKSKYPEAQIALLSSAMVNGNNRTILQNCLSAVKKEIDAAYPSDKPVAVHFFRSMQARGCTGHPSVEDHQVLAEELTPFFRELLNL